MKIIRYQKEDNLAILAAVNHKELIYDLPFDHFEEVLNEAKRRGCKVVKVIESEIATISPLDVKLESLHLLDPIKAKEVWASGVTYERSKEARNYEATGGKLDATTFYDKVYDAKRPEIFFKSTDARTIGPGEPVFLRSDSNWQIPEPELGLVLDSDGEIIGYTIGNDMSCRDIEGENPLYLPQAKIWKNSCSIGPAIRLAETVEDPYRFEITCSIYRNGEKVFEGSAPVSQLKRKLDELTEYLVRDNIVFPGTVLLTGTCIVPPNDFTLQEEDQIEIEIPGIGVLKNGVKNQVDQNTVVQ